MEETAAEALAAAAQGDDDDGLARALDALALELHDGWPVAPTPRLAPLAERVDGSRHPRAALVLAVLRREAGDVGSDVTALLARCESTADAVVACYAAHLEGSVAAERGDWVSAGTGWRLAADLAPADGWLQTRALAHLAVVEYMVGGDIERSLALVEQVVARSRRRVDRRVEADALLLGAFLHFCAGRIGVAEDLLDRADDAFASLPPAQRVDQALGIAARGVLAAVRGKHRGADMLFGNALRVLDAVDSDWRKAMVLGARDEFTATVDPRRTIADACTTNERCRDAGGHWSWGWAERGQAVAAAAVGHFKTAESALAHLLTRPLHPVERGRTLLALAETRVQAGHARDAVVAFEMARRIFEETGATYFLVRTLHGLAVAAPDQRFEAMGAAARLAGDDPADHLLDQLEIEVFGRGRVLVAGEAVAFDRDSSYLLVAALALAPGGAVPASVLIDRLWPGATEDHGRATLHQALGEAGRALGSEGWRLERRGELVLLDLRGVPVDLLDATAAASAALRNPAASTGALVEVARRLDSPVLRLAAGADWVTAIERDRGDLAERVRLAVALGQARAGWATPD